VTRRVLDRAYANDAPKQKKKADGDNTKDD